MRRARALASIVVVLVVSWRAGVALQRVPAVGEQRIDPPIPHERGQNVVPIFEGWYRDGAGALHLSWGYLNRNYGEELTIPAGPDNRIDPGPADQGQPTRFVARRQAGVFAVVVPKELEAKLLSDKKTVTWTLRSRGVTTTIPAQLGPAYAIDALLQPTTRNTPPSVRFAPPAERGPGQGPGGVRSTFKAVVSAPLTIDVWVAGAPNPGTTQGRGVTLTWTAYRGPGPVRIEPAKPKMDADGKASVTATFSEPGEYVLRMEALLGSNEFHCCWTNGYAQVSVSPAATQGR